MMIGDVDRARDLLEYDTRMNRVAAERVRDAAGGGDASGDARSALDRAREILAHVHAARRLWLTRIGAEVWEGDLFPRDVTDGTLEALASGSEGVVARFSDVLGEAELARVVRYVSTEGEAFESRVGEIVAHLGMHGAYHRGQVAMLVARGGGEPARTAHILWSRRSVP